MERIEATFEIKHDAQGVEITTSMPVIEQRVGKDDVVYVELPLLGVETYGKRGDDLDRAIDEVIQAFYIAAVRYGKGIDQELIDIGWTKKEKPALAKGGSRSDEDKLLSVPSQSQIMDNLLSIGKTERKTKVPEPSC